MLTARRLLRCNLEELVEQEKLCAQCFENLVAVISAQFSASDLQMMAGLIPFRDINVHASASHYAFTSPSTPSAPTLVIDRPSGDIRLNDGPLLGTKRVSSIAGILGIVKLKLGKTRGCSDPVDTNSSR
jgi:hypothetical protein